MLPALHRSAGDGFGQRWMQSSAAERQELTSCARPKCRTLPCRSNLAAAADSDGRLEGKLAASAGGFAALTVDAAASQMPRLQVTTRCDHAAAHFMRQMAAVANAQHHASLPQWCARGLRRLRC